MKLSSALPVALIFSVGIIFCEAASTFEKDVTLTSMQRKALNKFKAVVIDRLPHDYMKDDLYLLKWLRARNFDIPEAEQYLMKNLKWRKDSKMDGIHEEDWSDLQKEFKYFLESRDKTGQPVLYFDVGGMDVRKKVLQGQGERILRYADKILDEACGLVRTMGQEQKNVTRGNLIINVDGYNLVQHGCLGCVPFILRMVTSYEAHHPECADQIILLNTPTIIEPLLNTVRPLLSRGTNQALKIYGTNKRKNLEILSKKFDRSEIPIQIGGEKVYKGVEEDYFDF